MRDEGELSRRGLLGGLVGAAAWSLCPRAEAAEAAKKVAAKPVEIVQDIEQGKRGTTFTLALQQILARIGRKTAV